MTRLGVGLGLVVWLTLVTASAAFADPEPVTPDDNDFLAQVIDRDPGTLTPHTNGAPEQAPPTEIADLASTGACLGHMESCLAEPPAISNALVVSAVRRIAPPAGRLVVQPPGGKTLVNLDTIFSTRTEPFQRTVRLLGHQVVLKIWASSFSWQFGDESAPLVTTQPGRTYERGLPMDSYITHQYTDADVTVHPSVDTTYSAEYSVDGSPFQPVIGTVTIEGAPATLRVVEARPVLTGTR
jgi:hypothetical protein